MTPPEQIAHVRRLSTSSNRDRDAILAVCSLAERALLTDKQINAEVVARLTETERAGWDVAERLAAQLRLTDDEAEAVRDGLRYWMPPTVAAVLRRLLPDVPAEHRLLCGWCSLTVDHPRPTYRPDAEGRAMAVHDDCGSEWDAAHAGIGGTE